LHDRLLRGYIMDALEQAAAARAGTAGAGRRGSGSGADAAAPDVATAQHYLDAVRGAARTETASVGRGTYRVLSGAVIGGELMDDARIAHLSAFPTEQPRGGRPRPVHDEPVVAPPSRRRRHRGE
ncbi:MAG: hypothetical protein WEF86_15430, partial [Gemmatimonadota bacterium]